MVAEGEDLKMVQTVLDHTQLSTTLEVFGHPFPDATKLALDGLAARLAREMADKPAVNDEKETT
jgi:hypothetical protein